MTTLTRLNLFPTLVYVVECSDLIEPVKDLMKSVSWYNDYPYQSADLWILNSNLELAKEFEHRVNNTLSEIKYDVPFQLTTSWYTRTLPNKSITSHKHANCVWSTVFYFDDNCGELTFSKDVPDISLNCHAEDINLRMFGEASILARKGFMLLFPSSLYHSLKANNSNRERYSLAMNFMPKGMVLNVDSSYEYK